MQSYKKEYPNLKLEITKDMVTFEYMGAGPGESVKNLTHIFMMSMTPDVAREVAQEILFALGEKHD